MPCNFTFPEIWLKIFAVSSHALRELRYFSGNPGTIRLAKPAPAAQANARREIVIPFLMVP
jgi:hypothetical protein